MDDEDIIVNINWMHEFNNERYAHLKQVWLDMDITSMRMGVGLCFYLFCFHQFISFGKSQHYQNVGGLVGLSMSTMTYVGSRLGFYPLWVSAIVAILISFGQSWRQRKDYFRLVYSKLRLDSTFTPKGLVTPIITATVMISYLVVSHSVDRFRQQCYVFDSLLMLIIGALWVTQPAHLRYRDVGNILVIVFCLKLIYLCDNE